TLAAQSRDRLDLAIDLRRALEENGLELHYQPIVDLQTGYLLGVEALARWNHPQRGWVSPDLFVSVAEMGGFVRVLDEWVFRKATADLAVLRAQAHVPDMAYVSVNVSAV